MSTRLGFVALAGTFALAAGCTGTDGGTAPPRRIDLFAASGNAVFSPSGVAVDPTGARFVFDETFGLYQFGAGGALELILPVEQMPDPGQLVLPPYTDLVAIGAGRFAITAIGDGYLLDVGQRTMTRYFCYVPDGTPVEYAQRTDAVAYDPAAKLLYAQPRTSEGGNLISSQVASYSFETGADLDWVSLPLDIAAGGMAKLPGVDGLVLGNGSKLLQLDGAAVTELADLAPQGVGEIAGLAVDADAGTLLVLDRASDALVELDLAAVR